MILLGGSLIPVSSSVSATSTKPGRFNGLACGTNDWNRVPFTILLQTFDREVTIVPGARAKLAA